MRQLARLTRRAQRASGAGAPIADAYQPPPGPGRLPFQQRLLLAGGDPATWRDLVWSR